MQDSNASKAFEIALIPLSGAVLFPGAILPITSTPEEAGAFERALERRELGVVSVREGAGPPLSREKLADVAVRAKVLRLARLPNGALQAIIRGGDRVRLESLLQTEPFALGQVVPAESTSSDPTRDLALVLSLRRSLKALAEEGGGVSTELVGSLEEIGDPGALADLAAASIDLSAGEKQQILDAVDVTERLGRAISLVERRLEVAKLSTKIDAQVKGEMSKAQREHLLRQQLKAIQQELGEEEEEGEGGIDQLAERVAAANLPPEAEKAALRELKRLRAMSSASMEYSVARTYLEWLVELPWSKSTADRLELAEVSRILEARHHGLEKVKKRIIEYLAVRKLKNDIKGPILCLVGPPGVGKTSLAQSVADAMGRKLQRISLGGIRDEAEIRGHRRTYVGALPGRVVQGIKKAGSNNPVMVLDEVDKLGADFRGDPSSALLEVLDPEQNHTFSDHYLEVPLDLSKVLFIATANELDGIPPALRDRMEVIEIPGYTHQEKLAIAERHLVPKVLEAHGLTSEQIAIPRATVEKVIADYTREAGVRNLERSIAALVRAVAVKIAEGSTAKVTIGPDETVEYLGPERFVNELAERVDQPGVAIGLAWTPAGGDILFVEATKMAGKGGLALTGKLGDVMRESAQAALSLLRSRTAELGVPESFWAKTDLHVHLPAGAIPKDGPSAGAALVTALASLVTSVPIKHLLAMTGEVTLRGAVLPVGGIKEKVLAAARAGIREVILPARNQKDLWDVPAEVKAALTFHFVSRIDEVLAIALPGIPRWLPPPPPVMPEPRMLS